MICDCTCSDPDTICKTLDAILAFSSYLFVAADAQAKSRRSSSSDAKDASHPIVHNQRNPEPLSTAARAEQWMTSVRQLIRSTGPTTVKTMNGVYTLIHGDAPDFYLVPTAFEDLTKVRDTTCTELPAVRSILSYPVRVCLLCCGAVGCTAFPITGCDDA